MAASTSSSSAGGIMAVEAFRQVHPREYLRKFLKQLVRPDGRSLTKVRKTTIVTGSVTKAEGSALVRCGNTAVLCGIKAEIAEPTVAAPHDGYIVPNIDLSPMCSAKFRPGPPGDLAQAISQRLMNLITGSQAGASKILDLSQLCIEEGKSVWVLFADIVCLNYDGAVFDAAVIALLAALKNVRLPEASYDAEKRQVNVTIARPNSLKLDRLPISLTFGVFDGIPLADPTDQEETVSEGSLTIVSTDTERLLSVVQTTTVPMNSTKLEECIIVALTRAKEVTKFIEQS